MTLNEVLEPMVPSDRLVISDASGTVMYRGYVGLVQYAGLNMKRQVDKVCTGVEFYRKDGPSWDWRKTDQLPNAIPVEQVSKFQTGELEYIIYIRIVLKNLFE